MLLNELDVLTAQLTAVTYPNIQARTDQGTTITVHTSPQQRNDPAFWQSIRAIVKARLWVPVSKRLHQLSDTDWLAPSDPTLA